MICTQKYAIETSETREVSLFPLFHSPIHTHAISWLQSRSKLSYVSVESNSHNVDYRVNPV